MQPLQDFTQLQQLLLELKLKHWNETLQSDLQQMTETQRELILQYLSKWALQEKAERISQQIGSRIKSAKFKKIQTIDTFNFKHSKETESIEHLVTPFARRICQFCLLRLLKWSIISFMLKKHLT